MTERCLPLNAELSHVRDLLKHLIADANEYATRQSRSYARSNEPEKRTEAMYYFGQIWIMTQLLEKIECVMEKDDSIGMCVEIPHPRNI
jgi:hypothetical protein